MQKLKGSDYLKIFFKIILTLLCLFFSYGIGVFGVFILQYSHINAILSFIFIIVLPCLIVPLIWIKKRKKVVIGWLIFILIYLVSIGVNIGINKYNDSLVINTSPNIRVEEYLPFKEDSKIVKLENSSLKLSDNLPIVDGAAAVFPVYSAFVNAVYPKNIELYDDVFQYHNTVGGYNLLAEKQIDIFFGAYPSKEQREYAEECGTEFKYIPIGSEAFVFFVNKDNPVNNLTTEQIKGIYSGEITNWKEVGGKNEPIVAFQRNEGSGSQSMLKRFMGDTPIMTPPIEQVNDFMVGIIDQVANYKNKSNSIGFSFRYYVESIIQNPDIKMISIDGVEPTVENIKNGLYSITTNLYAVTYENNPNENVNKLIDWILSDEGQSIIEQTGYVGIK